MSKLGTKWQIRECREIWKEGRVWELEEGGLSVGRSEDCDIRLFSQTVESKHAVFEWSPKKETFIVRDLGSVNGTYINNQPIRETFAVLKHGDSIRFGYERSHVFRVEVVDLPSTSSLPPPSPTSTTATSTATATQTSPFEPQSTQANTVPHPVNVQYFPVPSQSPTIIIPTLQPTVPYVMPQTMAYGFPHIPAATHLYQPTFQPMHPPMPTQHSSTLFQHMSPTHLLQQQQPATPTSVFQNVSSAHSQTATSTSMHSRSMTVEDIESEGTTPPSGSPVLRRSRKDGRRPVSLYDSPSLSKASPLYGSPSWWGEEDSTGGSSDGEFGPPHLGTGAKILRDLDPHKSKEQESSRTRTSITDELRKQAISNRTQERERDYESPTSWSVEFGGVTAKRPSRFDRSQRPRSADPSPTQVRSNVSPVRRSKSPSVSPRQSPVLHRKTVVGGAIKRKDTSQKATTKKPPSGLRSGQRKSTPALSTTRSRHSPAPRTQSLNKEEPVSNGAIQNTGVESSPTQTTAAKETTKADQNLTYNITAGHLSSEDHSHSDLSTTSTPDRQAAHPAMSPLKCQSQTQVSREERTEQGDTHTTTFIVHGREADRPGSARKQWSSQPQPPDSLMLASIEARMRRLSKKAQGTAQAVGSLRHLETHERGILEAPSSPLIPLPKQDLPEWKFFNNKEVDSIFRSIRSVEKWLREIDAVMTSLQSSVGEQAENEEVDYAEDYGSSDSEVEMLPDSMEDGVCSGGSDTSDHEEGTQ